MKVALVAAILLLTGCGAAHRAGSCTVYRSGTTLAVTVLAHGVSTAQVYEGGCADVVRNGAKGGVFWSRHDPKPGHRLTACDVVGVKRSERIAGHDAEARITYRDQADAAYASQICAALIARGDVER